MANNNELPMDILSNSDKLYDREDLYNKDIAEKEDKKIDLFELINYLPNIFQDDNLDVCVCERELICKCKDDCICDSDDYHIIHKKTVCIGANSKLLTEFKFEKKVKLSKKKNLRFFTLNRQTEEEIPFMDLIRINEEKKLIDEKVDLLAPGRGEVSVVLPAKLEKVYLIQLDLMFPMLDGVSVKSDFINLDINYLLYE